MSQSWEEVSALSRHVQRVIWDKGHALIRSDLQSRGALVTQETFNTRPHAGGLKNILALLPCTELEFD